MDYKEKSRKIVHMSLWDSTGHIFNGYDICEEINKDKKFESRMLVMIKQTASDFVSVIGNKIVFWFIKMIKYGERLLSLQNIFSPVYHFIKNRKDIKDADIVHLQLVHFNYFSLSMIKKLTQRKRVIWTIHDPWVVTGHCIHPKYANCDKWKENCGNCPDLSIPFPLFLDTTRLLKKRKRRIFKYMEIDLVLASDMMISMVKESNMFPRARIFKIPFGVKTDVFYPRDQKTTREKYSIPEDNFVIMFRIDSGQFKGSVYIKELFSSIKIPNCTLIAVGEEGNVEGFRDNYNHIIEFDWIHSDEMLSELYSVSDMFLMPSTAESFGLMAIEAMACKTPVIGFKNTAFIETLSDSGGYLVNDGDSKEFQEAVLRLYEDSELRLDLAEKGYEKVQKKYRFDNWIENIKKLYEDTLDPL